MNGGKFFFRLQIYWDIKKLKKFSAQTFKGVWRGGNRAKILISNEKVFFLPSSAFLIPKHLICLKDFREI